jgi:hypothetical protein
MLSLEDKRWEEFCGGYRMKFDARPLLIELRAGREIEAVWKELWDELHHQGDVGEASYAAIPHLVKIYRERGVIDWNAYAIVAVIELARTEGGNPEVPEYLKQDYFKALDELAELGAKEILKSSDAETTRSILGVLAITRGLKAHGKFIFNYSEQELLEIEKGFCL